MKHLYPAYVRRELDYNQTIIDLDPVVAADLSPLERACLAAHGAPTYGALVAGNRVYLSGND